MGRELRLRSRNSGSVAVLGTASHHLNGMEAEGLLTRRRDPTNRRIHLVELTDAGNQLFHRLRAAAVAHDEPARPPTDQRAHDQER